MIPNRLGMIDCRIHLLKLWLPLFAACLIILSLVEGVGIAAPSDNGEATILLPNRLGGATAGDERAVDIYPAVAYDPITQRYLAVWMTLRNAQSSSAGFDVYGIFLNSTGQSVSDEFRISDGNTAARNGFPVVVAGNGEFVVAWTVRGASCQIRVQRVTDTLPSSDQVLISGAGHRHSPALVYNPVTHYYVLTYVEGDDYLPPTFLGAETADCGNNASATSHIKAVDFYFNDNNLTVGTSINVSDMSSGAFRPRLAYSRGLNQYMVVWEDRRNAGGQVYRFDVYAQRLDSNMTVIGNDIALATSSDYANYDTSATWTPRPAVSGSSSNFIATWFNREEQNSVIIWSVMGSLVSASGTPGVPFTIAQMPFAQSHLGQSPTGFLATTYLSSAQEYLVGMTSHLESLWGYFSFALIQRVRNNGQLLKMDGSSQSGPGVGSSVDFENDDQIMVGMTTNPVGSSGTADYMIVYSKHSTNLSAQDFDIWGTRVEVQTPGSKNIYLPLTLR